MKELRVELTEGDFIGNYVVKVPKRAERGELQLRSMKIGSGADANLPEYYALSEKLLDENLVSICITHVQSGALLSCRDDLEYIQDAEPLISAIVSTVVGGERLGKKNA